MTKAQRDKVTLICSESLHDLGAWLEQLLAESTDKQGRGLIPVDCEPLLEPEGYGKDRVFAYIRFAGDNGGEQEEAVGALEKAGHPVVRLVLSDLYDIGRIFFQWEIATAVAGSLIGINVFNQPDVDASKMATRELTAQFEKTGCLPPEKPILEQDGIQLFTNKENADALLNGSNTLGAVIRQHLDLIKPGDYFGLLAYIPSLPITGPSCRNHESASWRQSKWRRCLVSVRAFCIAPDRPIRAVQTAECFYRSLAMSWRICRYLNRTTRSAS